MPCHSVFWLFYHSINVLNALFIHTSNDFICGWISSTNQEQFMTLSGLVFRRKKRRIVLINMMMAHSRGFSIICTSLFENINNYINFCLNDSIYSRWILWIVIQHIIFDGTSDIHGRSFHFWSWGYVRWFHWIDSSNEI